MRERTGVMTMEEFIRLYQQEGPFELVNGERIALSPNISRHGVVAKRLIAAFVQYELANAVGEFFYEQSFVISDDPNWVSGSRVPDLMFFSIDRLDAYKLATPNWQDKPFVLVPDLAVEILSPTDRYADIQEKVESYLRDGVLIVWVADPARESVTVYQDDTYHTLSSDATLAASDLLPDFSLPIAAIFQS